MSKSYHLQYIFIYSSKSTTDNAKYSIKLFLQSVYGEGNLEELVDRYFNENRDIEEGLKTFFATHPKIGQKEIVYFSFNTLRHSL